MQGSLARAPGKFRHAPKSGTNAAVFISKSFDIMVLEVGRVRP